MTEPAMLSKEAFIDFILKGPAKDTTAKASPEHAALPEGFQGFDTAASEPAASSDTSTFARRLLEAAGFGYPELVGRDSVIRSGDAVARYLPDRVSFWPKTTSRPYQTLLFEASLTHKQLLEIPAFRGHKMSHLDIVEDALVRLVSEALEGFQRGGESVTADVRRGRKDETLCVVSIVDEREGEPTRLVCFGTHNEATEGLETFQITERTRFWDAQLAREHLGLLYERQFKKLAAGKDWQEAFTTTEERKQAEKLLHVCTRKAPKVADIQEVVLDLLDTIAKSFGLKKKPNTQRRLQAFELPADHDIGIDPEERAGKFGGHNPFGGVTLRDERNRLLGYIIYPLKAKGDAARLREHLEANNRFHNVLVVYPDQDQASLELWQGRDQLRGKLRQGQEYKDAADVVNLLSRFFVVSKATVRNPSELAEELAYRARYLRRLAAIELKEEKNAGPLRNLYNAFKEALVHDQTEDEFADAFAQTITYGLLTARWLGSDQLAAAGERLTRQTALKHLAAGNPFLNDLFKSVLSVRLDEQRGRLLWLVDDIADLLDRIDVQFVFGAGDVESDAATDPVIHFYEPFLAAYDKDMKNKRGVFFTPRPVVSYIVRSVHELLRTEFGLEAGLASTETWGQVASRKDGLKIPDGVKSADPFVRVLDPAVGTGTFLYECIEVIEREMKERWRLELQKDDWHTPEVTARWNTYVRDHLLPRLFGYELMMAPYAVAHLKLAFKLGQTGYRDPGGYHLSVYLTNSLEPPSDLGQQKLAGAFPALAREARAVNAVKRNQIFTVVLGNPPYSKMSQNKGEWIDSLMERYKTTIKTQEIQRQALSNDYVKFVCVASEILGKSTARIFAMITDNSYLDGPLFRDMRADLLSTLSKLTITNLNGNSRKGVSDLDDNVFDIQQGVAIMVGVSPSRAPGVLYFDVKGSRASKYSWLKNAQDAQKATSLQPRAPAYLLVPQTDDATALWEAGWRLPDLFAGGTRGGRHLSFNGAALATRQDTLTIAFTKDELKANLKEFFDKRNSKSELTARFGLCTTSHFSFDRARKELDYDVAVKSIMRVLYRPFDTRWIAYHPLLVGEPRPDVMGHLLKENVALLTTRRVTGRPWDNLFVTKGLVEYKAATHDRNTQVFPLYLYSKRLRKGATTLWAEDGGARIPNLTPDATADFEAHAGLRGPEAIFEYCYGLISSPAYRERFKQQLEQDYPRVLIPRDRVLAASIQRKGRELVALHSLESPSLARTSVMFHGPVRPKLEVASFEAGTVWTDRKRTCGFVNVPGFVWEFHIGGYQVCEKWLKDRKGRVLSNDDIDHYKRIVVAVSETIRITEEIDDAIHKHGGWAGAFEAKPTRGAQ
jgi:hypothetical protein